jgi:hypothetical protein
MMTKRVVMLLICGIFLTMTCAFDAAEPAEAPNANTGSLSVAIAVPKSTSGNNDRQVFAFNRNGHFHVLLKNTSDAVIRLLDVGNADYQKPLAFEITDETGNMTLVHWTSAQFSGSARPPYMWVLEPQESMALDIDFMNDHWIGFPKMPIYGGSFKLQMRAVYEIKPDAVTQRMGIWTGRSESESDSFVFESRLSSGTDGGVGGVAEVGQGFGEVRYHMENEGPDYTERLKTLTVSSNGKDMPIPIEALQGLHKPWPSTHQITVEPGADGRPMLYFSFELGESVKDKGAPTTPRVYFGFQDGKFVRRFTSILRRHIISEW